MGYDSCVEAFDTKGKYMGCIIDDISFRALIEFIRFCRKQSLDEEELDSEGIYLFGDINCKDTVAKDFLECCKKNKTIDEFHYRTMVLVATEIANNPRIKYFSITSV